MLFALSTVTATASTLVKENIVKDVFISKEKITVFVVLQEKSELSVLSVPDRQSLQLINYNKKSNVFLGHQFSDKSADILNKDVVWLTNMKSK